MDRGEVAALRGLLASTGWLERTAAFALALRRSSRTPGGLLVVGTPDAEPWHLAAHLDEESRLSGVPELAPTLIRWNPPPGAPPHLRTGLGRIEEARRGETLLVVSPHAASDALLERVHSARRVATILALDQGDAELEQMAHEVLTVAPGRAPVSFDAAQHLVSAAAGTVGTAGAAGQRPWAGLRERLGRLLDAVSGPSAFGD
jgi:hypothetical protein